MVKKPRREPPAPKGFWQLVRRAMAQIYGSEPRLADEFRATIWGMDPKMRAFFYHSDPLSVAANLVGRSITDEDAEVYRRLPEWRVYAGLESPSATELVMTDREVRAPETHRRVTQAELAKEVAGETNLSAKEVRKVIDVTFSAIRRLGATAQPARRKAVVRGAKR
jgi:hypothetical protein